MLTAEHARINIKGEVLKIRGLGPKTREAAAELAEHYDRILKQGIGLKRGEIKTALDAVSYGPRQQRLANGLRKLICDRAEFEKPKDAIALDIREALFTEAARARRSESKVWDRDAVMAAVAARFSMSESELESTMYSDLKNEHRLIAYRSVDPSTQLDEYIFAQYEAVLLKATQLSADVVFSNSDQAKSFFRKLKFFRLLAEITWQGEQRYRLSISGPHALFRSNTKYGLQLALAFRHLSNAHEFRMIANLEWGKQKKPLIVEVERDDLPRLAESGSSIRDEVASVIGRLKAQSNDWTVSLSTRIIHLPGHDVCVPDILLRHRESGRKVYVELMGFWSREAVFRRVDLLKTLEDELVIIAASDRLRVSDAVAGDLETSRLYVFKGVVNAKRLLGLADGLLAS